MSDELFRALQFGGIGGTLIYFFVLLLKVERAVLRRFDEHLANLRNDNRLLTVAVERLERDLATVRDARRADNHRCDQQLAELRARIDELSG